MDRMRDGVVASFCVAVAGSGVRLGVVEELRMRLLRPMTGCRAATAAGSGRRLGLAVAAVAEEARAAGEGTEVRATVGVLLVSGLVGLWDAGAALDG